MAQLDLSLAASVSESKPIAPDRPAFTTAYILNLWCAEPIFFASRELSDTYYTEGTIGNYALAYALGWARSPYRLQGRATHRPSYIEDLTTLIGDRYILPAWPTTGSASFRFERFNALSDSYWYAMTNNRVATRREDLPLKRTGKKPGSFRPSNFPQTGRMRVIERGNQFQTIVFGHQPLKPGDRDLCDTIPDYIRVGKFMGKVRVTVSSAIKIQPLPPGDYTCNTYLNTADLPDGLTYQSFDLLSIPPVPLMKNLHFHSAAWRIGDRTVPAGLGFFAGGHDQ
jgi:CRISPR-associated protein Csc1